MSMTVLYEAERKGNLPHFVGITFEDNDSESGWNIHGNSALTTLSEVSASLSTRSFKPL